MNRRRAAFALALASLLLCAGLAAWRIHRAEALLAAFLPSLRMEGDGYPLLADRGRFVPRGFELLREHHGKFVDTPAPAPGEMVPLPLSEGAAPVPLRRPFLAYGKGLTPKLKTFKDLLKSMPLVLKDVYAVAVPKDLGVFPQHARTPLLDEPFLRDCARFAVQLSAGAASLGRTDMAALLATFPCNLGVASVNRGQGFGNATVLPTLAFAFEAYRLGACALLALAEGPLSENACGALENAGAALEYLQPLPQVAKTERDAYFDALETLAAQPAALSRREEVARALASARALHDESFAPLLAALESGDPAVADAALARYEAARAERAARDAAEGWGDTWTRLAAPERLLARRLAVLPSAPAPLLLAQREARALSAALVVAARLCRLEAERKFPTTSGYFETLTGAKLPRSGFDPRRPVDLSFAAGRAVVRDGGRVVFSRPFGAGE